jgi:hypothetical protein
MEARVRSAKICGRYSLNYYLYFVVMKMTLMVVMALNISLKYASLFRTT